MLRTDASNLSEQLGCYLKRIWMRWSRAQPAGSLAS